MERRSAVVVCAVALGMAASATAVAQTFDFGNVPGGPVGASSWAVTIPPFTLTAYGWNADNSPNELFWKNAGPDEHGIGFVNTLDNELTLAPGGTAIANYIQVDVSQVYLVSPTGQIRVQSVTDGEEYDLYGSNTLGDIGTKILSASTIDNTFFDIPNWGTYKFISVAVTPQGAARPNDNVLMDAILVVPEPAALSLLVLGSLAWLRRRA